jgi:hypothetical protein
MNGFLLKRTNMAPIRGLFDSRQCPDANVRASDNNGGNTLSKDTQFGQPAIQFHPPPPPSPGYSYPPLQPPFPGALQFYHQAPFNMTPSSQPSPWATPGYQSYRPSWQAYDFPQGGYGGPQMFPSQQFTGHGSSPPGAPREAPAPPEYNPVIQPTSSASTALGQLPGTPGKPPIAFQTKRFQPAAGPCRTDVAGITNLPTLPEISYDQYDADYESNDSPDLGGAKSIAPISLKQTEFS